MTTDELEKLRRLNFGIRALSEKIDPDLLVRQIERYDAADAAEVSRRFRAGSDLGSVVEDAIALYGDVIAEYRGCPPPTLWKRRARPPAICAG